jgi:hypothetical protein
MIPAIYPGDLVTVRSQPITHIRPGDIVLCVREGRFWLHRVTRKWPHGSLLAFATQGDALPHEDPPVLEPQFLGQVISITRYGKSVRLSRSNMFWSGFLQWSIRNCTFLATSFMRIHSLRTRLFRASVGVFAPDLFRSPGSIG